MMILLELLVGEVKVEKTEPSTYLVLSNYLVDLIQKVSEKRMESYSASNLEKAEAIPTGPRKEMSMEPTIHWESLKYLVELK